VETLAAQYLMTLSVCPYCAPNPGFRTLFGSETGARTTVSSIPIFFIH